MVSAASMTFLANRAPDNGIPPGLSPPMVCMTASPTLNTPPGSHILNTRVTQNGSAAHTPPHSTSRYHPISAHTSPQSSSRTPKQSGSPWPVSRPAASIKPSIARPRSDAVIPPGAARNEPNLAILSWIPCWKSLSASNDSSNSSYCHPNLGSAHNIPNSPSTVTSWASSQRHRLTSPPIRIRAPACSFT